jgi:hypothetical protein
MTDPQRPVFRVRLVAMPSDVPAAVRLKRFLKAALRGYGLRCVEALEEPRANSPPKEESENA